MKTKRVKNKVVEIPLVETTLMETMLVETIVERQIGGNFPHLHLLVEFVLVKTMLVDIF